MRRFTRLICTMACAASLAAIGLSTASAEEIRPLEPVRVYGNAVKEEESRLHLLGSGPHSPQDMIITVSDQTLILDAVDGFPVAFGDIPDHSMIYAYIGPAVTASLPPISNATLVICNIPADYKVPEYLKVDSFTWNDERTYAYLRATNGSTYSIPADCPIIPYLTRNYVTLDALEQGRVCLLWSDINNKASKIVLFAPEISDDGSTEGMVQATDHLS